MLDHNKVCCVVLPPGSPVSLHLEEGQVIRGLSRCALQSPASDDLQTDAPLPEIAAGRVAISDCFMPEICCWLGISVPGV